MTTFFIRHRVDTGDIILQEKVAIGENETAGELHDRLARVGADVLLKTLDGIASNHVGKISQCGASSPAPKILSEHGWIHWEKSALEIHNLIRGLSPKPGAYTQLNGDRLKIYRSRIADEITESRSIPGTVVRCDKKGLLVQTGSGCLFVLDVHPEGKKKMEIAEFLCGRSIPSGIRLGDTDRQ